MKNSGRAIATVAVMVGIVAIAYFTKDSCTAAICMLAALFLLWADADGG